jgi:hypothetical protein
VGLRFRGRAFVSYPSPGFVDGREHYGAANLPPLDFTDTFKDLSTDIPSASLGHFQSPHE